MRIATKREAAGLGQANDKVSMTCGVPVDGGLLTEAAEIGQPGVRIGSQISRGTGLEAETAQDEVRGQVRITLDHAVIADRW
jgi:hypothetical protein